ILRDSMVKTHITISHDGNGVISCVLRRNGGIIDRCDIGGVDISGLLGGDMGYIGLTGATGGSVIQQGYLGDITWDPGAPSATRQEVCQYGGNIALGGGTLNAAINNLSPLQSVSAFDTLTFADGATLNAEMAVKTLTPDFASHGLWTLNGHSVWQGDTLRLTRAENNSIGTFFSNDRFNVTNAWDSAFTYLLGENSGAPADFVTFTIQNIAPTENIPGADPRVILNGLTLMWEYYTQRDTTASDGNKGFTQLRLYTNGLLVATAEITPVRLVNRELTDIAIAYDPPAQTLTVICEQPSIGAAHTNTFANVDMAAIMGSPDGRAHIGFTARCGGQHAENFISGFTFDGARDILPAAALAFRRYDGTGLINHHGTAPLALLGDIDHAPADATLRLSGGGLTLRRATDEPLGTAATRGDWGTVCTNLNWQPYWNAAGDAVLTPNQNYITAGFASLRRINVARDFTADFTYTSANAGADGFSVVFHNDPRGPAAMGGTGSSLGYADASGAPTPITKSFAVRFNIYDNNVAGAPCQIGIGKNGAWIGGFENTINLKNTTVNMAMTYDATAKTLTVTLTNTEANQTHVFPDVDLPALAESDYATVAIIGATGGQNVSQSIRNFILDYPAPVTVTDERLAIGGTEIPAGETQVITLHAPTVTSPAFLINEGTFGDGSTLRLESATGGTLRYANATFGGPATFDIQPGATLALCGPNGDATLNLCGGNTDISGLATGNGTLLNLSGGATVTALPKRIIGGATLNGVKLPAGIYRAATTPWVASGQVNIGSVGTIILLR
ncbi:MAG: hypothetical protein FWG50_12505, partial [Kiritimatiellaeota bacterium]|nr:hypothetical protein [Kiritimatiellota bacterium]